MAAQTEGRRVLVTAAGAERAELCELFVRGLLPGWEVLEADSFERARFAQQLDPCDVLLLDGSLTSSGDCSGLRWLTASQPLPVLFLSDAGADVIEVHLQQGVTHWLSRQLALRHPGLLAALLQQAAHLGGLQRLIRQREETLLQCRRQVNRLVGLLWQTLPIDPRTPWFTQRHMMERLQEEVVRCQRHGAPLTVVLGEIGDSGDRPGETGDLTNWTAMQVSQHKRRCDVAGQYGPHGFMLLLPHTSDRGAIGCCRRLRAVLETPPSAVGTTAAMQVSFGIAAFSPSTATVKSLLGRAEERLEQARDNPPERLAF